ncbi:hypothetical protein ACIQUB_28200 [Rhizobium sp. NPDC090275]|uniref:hypothetical protein n=1 Tax=Rhizobium sp. NPDC090275 TaxID=3364498 RepID=UPI000DE1612C
MEYNILILLPQIQEPQNYKIEIDIHSRAALIKRASTQMGPSAMIFRILANQTGDVRISYVDYNVSLNFMIAIDHWFEGLQREKDNKALSFLKQYSHNFSFIFKYMTVTCFLLFCYFSTYPSASGSLAALSKYGVFVFGLTYILGGFAAKLGDWVERSVDSMNVLSYVRLNRGDENLIEETRRQNRSSFLRVLVGLGFAIGVNILSSYLASSIGID